MKKLILLIFFTLTISIFALEDIKFSGNEVKQGGFYIF